MSHQNTHLGQIIEAEKVSFNLLTYENHDDETFDFATHPALRGKQYEIALSKIKIWLTMNNIHASMNNHQLIFTIAGIQHTVQFPSGNYTLYEINNYMKRYFSLNSLPSNLIVFDANPATGKVSAVILNDVLLDTSVGTEFYTTLGFTGSYLNNTGGVAFFDATDRPKLNYYYSPATNNAIKINSIFVHCDAVNTRSYANNANSGNIIKSTHSVVYKLTPLSTQTQQVEEPYNLEFQHMKAFDSLSDIRMYLTNEENTRLGGMITEPIIYTLLMKEYAQ